MSKVLKMKIVEYNIVNVLDLSIKSFSKSVDTDIKDYSLILFTGNDFTGLRKYVLIVWEVCNVTDDLIFLKLNFCFLPVTSLGFDFDRAVDGDRKKDLPPATIQYR